MGRRGILYDYGSDVTLTGLVKCGTAHTMCISCRVVPKAH